MPTAENKRVVLAVCVAGAAVALLGGAYCLRRRKRDDDEDLLEFNASGPLAAARPAEAPAATPAATEKALPAAPPQKIPDLTPAAPKAVEPPAAKPAAAPAAAPAPAPAPAPERKAAALDPADPNVKSFDDLHIKFRCPKGWKASSETNAMPGVAMVALEHEDFPSPSSQEEMGMPGEVPVLVLTVEDISMEALTLEEFKEKSKMVAIQQLAMLTRGMVMPKVTFDGPKAVGPFQVSLEYSTQFPPVFAIQVMNLIAERDGFAYVMQLMANTENFKRFKRDALALAESVVLEDIPTTSSKTELRLKCGRTFRVPAAWSPGKEADSPAKLREPCQQLLHLLSPSPTKPESVVLYGVPGKSGEALAEAMHAVATQASMNPKAVETIVHAGQTVWHFKCDKHVEALVHGDAAWIVVPRHGGASRLRRNHLLDAVTSGAAGPSREREAFVFINEKYGYHFEVVRGSKLVEPRFGDVSVNYAPEGVSLDPEEPDDSPLFSVRAGELEDEDPKTLEEWKAKLGEDAGSALQEQELTTVAGQRCFTFTVKEMQETMDPSMKEEKMARVYIFLNGNATVMFRWECPTGSWPRYLPKLNRLLQTLGFAW